MDFLKVISSINLANPSWDVFVLITFAVGVYFYLFRWGKDRAFIALLSTYVAYGFISRLPLIEKTLGTNLDNTFTNKTIIFLGAVFALLWIFTNSSFVSIFSRGSKSAWFPTLVMGFLQIGLIISIVVSFLSPVEAKNLSIFLKSVFVENGAQFFWFVSPFLAIFLLKEK